MADISEPALEKASVKLKQLVPSAHKVEVKVSTESNVLGTELKPCRSQMSRRRLM
jgi:hypothetical protein